MDATQWLQSLYLDVPEGFVVLWRSDTKRSTFLDVTKGFASASLEVERCKKVKGANIYFGLGIQKEEVRGRGSEDSVVAIPGVWVDIDYANKDVAAGNQKQYPTLEVVGKALDSLPLKPSIIVRTGGGLHVYWIFNEPFLIENSDDTKRARKLTWGWQKLIKTALCKANDGVECDIDSTADLSRILRLPSGWMHKYEKTAELAEGYEDPDQWVRYGIESVEEFAADVEPPTKQDMLQVGPRIEGITLDITADPDADLFAVMFDESDFKRVWNHKKSFASLSEYEMSLSSQAAYANWPLQEIANLIIAHRRKYGGDMKKVIRPDYMIPMIQKAVGDMSKHASLQTLNGMPDEASISTDNQPTSSNRDRIVRNLSNVFGVEIEGWIQYGLDDPLYSLALANGEDCRIGNARDVLSGSIAFQAAIYARCQCSMQPVSRRAWPGVCQSLAEIVTVVAPDDSKREIVVVNDVESYLSRAEFYTEDGKAIACSEKAPMLVGGVVYIFFDKFFAWLNLQGRGKYVSNKVQDDLRTAGFETKQFGYRDPDTKASRSRYYWGIDARRVGAVHRVPRYSHEALDHGSSQETQAEL